MELERTGNVAVLRMDAGKGNAISPDFLDALAARLAAIGDARALVLTGTGRFFSAGLALPLLVDLDREAMRAFMQRFGDVVLAIARLQMPTIAAINGHAIAGGCVLALQCDYRLMASEGGKIGLSEVTLGIGLPTVVVESLRFHVPGRALFPIALRGELCDPARAAELGLVDEVVAAESLLDAAVAKAEQLSRAGTAGYAQIKSELLRPMLSATERHSAAGLESWLDTWFSDDARAIVGAAVAKLSK